MSCTDYVFAATRHGTFPLWRVGGSPVPVCGHANRTFLAPSGTGPHTHARGNADIGLWRVGRAGVNDECGRINALDVVQTGRRSTEIQSLQNKLSQAQDGNRPDAGTEGSADKSGMRSLLRKLSRALREQEVWRAGDSAGYNWRGAEAKKAEA